MQLQLPRRLHRQRRHNLLRLQLRSLHLHLQRPLLRPRSRHRMARSTTSSVPHMLPPLRLLPCTLTLSRLPTLTLLHSVGSASACALSSLL